MSTRGWRVVVAGLIVGALFVPVVVDRDSYPLSTYPMYSRVRADDVGIVTAQGVDAAGARIELSIGTVADTDDPLVAEALLRQAVREGEASRSQLCREVAGRVSDARVVVVEVVTEVHDVVAQASGDESLRERTLHASCEVVP